MKKNLLYSILVGAAVASLASCDVNSWNDKLDGFDGEQSIVDAQAIEYTLTDADELAVSYEAMPTMLILLPIPTTSPRPATLLPRLSRLSALSTISLTKFRQRSMFPIS